MEEKVLIVEDQFVEAHDLKLMLQKEGYKVCGIARDVPTALSLIRKEKPGLVLVDIFLQGTATGIDLAHTLKEEGIAFIYTSANSNREVLEAAKKTEPYGFLVKPYREKDLLVTLEIARYRHQNSNEAYFKKELVLQRTLSSVVKEEADTKDKLLRIAIALQAFIPFDFIYMGYAGKNTELLSDIGFLRVGFNEYQTLSLQELQIVTNRTEAELVELRDNVPQYLRTVAFDKENIGTKLNSRSLQKVFAENFSMNSHLIMPVELAEDRIFNLYFYSRRADVYDSTQITLSERLQHSIINTLMIVLRSANALHENDKINEKETPALKKDIPACFSGIIGKSHLLLTVFDNIVQVAPVDTSVLILGESGTGKERIAECIHELSPRSKQPLIKINCAALPANLIESELFGHEKGAFTGAFEKRIGKFELANKGTVFLDEIGELPLELQSKLLRVLQEKEIERIGGREPIKIDVRIIAATNRNLEKEVGEGRFRLDLYYRLNIFPVQLPSLRDRIEDVPLLADHFLAVYNKKSGKKISGISAKVYQQLKAYSWPGNIRELENFMERSVLLEKEAVLREIVMPNFATVKHDSASSYQPTKSIEENEKSHIISVLKKCSGKVWGIGGAAEVLNVPPTTLNSKMKKFGIMKRDFKDNI
ncbi:sigma 54-interacting transcriptional regulator [Flavobacterium hauense]